MSTEALIYLKFIEVYCFNFQQVQTKLLRCAKLQHKHVQWNAQTKKF